MIDFAWAQNKDKLARAANELRVDGVEASEEAIKARYIELAGKVLADNGNAVANEDTIKSEDDKPKKAKKK